MKISSPPMKEANRLTRLWQDHGPNTYPLDISALIDGALQNSDFSGELKTKGSIRVLYANTRALDKNS